MKLGIITQNTIDGGLDTFLINFINSIKDSDIVLFYNSNKNLNKLNNYISKKNYKIVRYNYFISNYSSKYKNKIIKKLINFYLFTFNIFINAIRLNFLFKPYNLDKLMVVNGGYPGGEICISSIIAWSFKNKNNKAWLNVHNYPQDINKYKFLRKYYENQLDKLISKSVNGIITVSKSCKKDFLKRPFLDYKKISYIYNGFNNYYTDHKSYSIKKILNINEKSKIVLLPAVFEKRKGQSIAIYAFNEILKYQNNIHLLLCGNGTIENKNDIFKLINKLNLEKNIHMIDFKNNLNSYYKISDIVIIPSLKMESFGYTAIEAMSFKVPVIASKIGGLKEIIKHNHSGYLVKINDYIDFSNKVRHLINNDDLRNRIGENGYNNYKKYFSTNIMASKYKQKIGI